MIGTSMMSGTLVRVVVPSASSAAAMTLSTLFLAPLTVTSPVSRAPPYTRKQSTRPLYGLRWRAGDWAPRGQRQGRMLP